MTNLPPLNCDGCTACCKKEAISILPHERGQYHTEVISGDVHILAHKDNGDCFYLGENGCVIHDRKPQKCKELDCRNVILAVRRMPKKARQKMEQMIAPEVIQAARKRLRNSLCKGETRGPEDGKGVPTEE